MTRKCRGLSVPVNLPAGFAVESSVSARVNSANIGSWPFFILGTPIQQRTDCSNRPGQAAINSYRADGAILKARIGAHSLRLS